MVVGSSPVKLIVTNCKDTVDLNYPLQLLAFDIFSFGLSSVISKVFSADFEHVFICWERYRIIAVLILKYLAQSKLILTQSE